MIANVRKLLALAVLSALVGSVGAEDMFPPDFRGDPLSTTSEWDFLLPPEWPAWEWSPDGLSGITNNPFGPSVLMDGAGWVGETGPGPGGAVGDFVQAWLQPFSSDPFGEVGVLFVRVQVTYTSPQGQDPPGVTFYLDSPPDGGTLWETTAPVPGTTDWYVYAIELWEPMQTFWDMGCVVVVYSPYDQSMCFSELVIDTVPEPATAALLAVGGLAALRRRRRSRKDRGS